MAKQILLPHEQKRDIMEVFKVNKVTLWNALTYNSNSAQAKRLRAAAFERGGRLFDGTVAVDYKKELTGKN